MASSCCIFVLLFLGPSIVNADGGYGHDYHNYGKSHGNDHAAYGMSKQHYGHYHYAKTTCADHYKPGIKDGHYKVYSMHHMGPMKVLCDFTSEPGMAYTLVMASSSVGRADANVMTIDDNFKNPFIDIGLNAQETSAISHSVNSNIPNTFAYRQAKADMDRIGKASKVFRMQCGTGNRDLAKSIRAKLSVVNPVTLSDTANCYETEYLNMDSKSCVGCKASIEQQDGKIFRVVDSSGCDGSSDFESDDELVPSDTGDCSGDVKLWFGKAVH